MAAEDLRQGSYRASMRHMHDAAGGTSEPSCLREMCCSVFLDVSAWPQSAARLLVCCLEQGRAPAGSLCVMALHCLPMRAVLGISSEDAEVLQQQNAALKDALDTARQELFEVYKQASRRVAVAVLVACWHAATAGFACSAAPTLRTQRTPICPTDGGPGVCRQ